MFKSISYSSAPQQIINQVRNSILQKKLRPGDKLPAEKELMDQFGVSKQTLREALRALEYLSLIEIRKGVNGGAFVAEVDRETTIANLINFLHFKDLSIEHISEVRKVIEPYCAGIAAESISDEDLKELKATLDFSEHNSSQGYSPETTKREIRFHRIIANTTHNPIMIFILDFIENLLQDMKDILRPDKVFSEAVIQSHKRIYDAIVDRDSKRATNEMLKDIVDVGERLSELAKKHGYNTL